jgi:hypothetical protein
VAVHSSSGSSSNSIEKKRASIQHNHSQNTSARC